MIERLTKANQRRAAVHNRRMVIQLLRQYGAMSRPDIERMTGVGSSTLSYIVRDLLDQNMICTAGKRKSSGMGKKQTLLEMNPGLGWVVGVGIDGDTADLAILNASGNVIDHDKLVIGHDLMKLPELLSNYIDTWKKDRGAAVGQMLGVGVGLPGPVDSRKGVLLESHWFKVSNINLAEMIAKEVQAPVQINNDANFAALAEARLGGAVGENNFAYLLMTCHQMGEDKYHLGGFGSTLFLNGALYTGSHFGSGEVDPRLQPESDPDTYISADELCLLSTVDGDTTDRLDDAARRVGSALAMVVNLVDPTSVIIGGDPAWTNRKVIAAIESEMLRHLVHIPGREVSIVPAKLVDHAITIGAAIAATDFYMNASGTFVSTGDDSPGITTASYS